ncbi:hypothetical protein J1N35_023599 [Gossypium stocksii]|uniref:Uncharacterized protein n=1 Tax=Gossypium stocksii TaxID=47602 RepID=A0A9D3VJ36_9ROSI|nr:hypothetical protein J1N35_023599 [Gossypium stocksii]
MESNKQHCLENGGNIEKTIRNHRVQAMDPLGSVIVETGKCIFSFFFTSIAIFIKLQHNTGRLRKEFKKLEDRKNGIEEDVRLAETEGKCSTEQVKG